MNKVTTVNLGGNAYPLEESGYELLRAYLEDASRALAGNPDRDEIIADIERAIAEKFRAALGPYQTVVAAKDVERVLREMGPVEGGAAPGAEPGAAPPPPPPPPKRLYLIHEGAMLGGVCNGIAAYLGVDVTLVRVLFVLVSLAYGTGVLVYVLLLLLLPTAHTPEEKAAATGLPKTAQEFIRRAREGYYEHMKGFRNRRAYREWRRKFKQDMRGWSHEFKREMKENAQQWQANWHRHWAERGWPDAAPSLALPLLSLLCGLAGLLALLAVLSLLFKGAVLGVPPPRGMPIWLAIVLFVVIYQVLVWPLKAARHACRRRRDWGVYPPPPFGWTLGGAEGLLWLILVAALVWFADRHSPGVHAALRDLGPQLHHAADAVKRWWDGTG